ncbi:MAG: tetratricopeptide repeat protein [Candidatus Latescibacteria bacterium]|nr:tetratricopeptide repeat protein [Candidatus Latescibacterota bacterium]
MMKISTYLRANYIPLLIVGLCAALVLVERYQRRIYEHMQPRIDPRAQPQLRGAALSELAQVLHELYPEGAQANVLTAQALIEKGRFQEARQHLEQALQTRGRDQGLLFLYAQLLLDLGEEPEKVRVIVDEIRRYFPRSREKIEDYFERASKGRMNFAAESIY